MLGQRSASFNRSRQARSDREADSRARTGPMMNQNQSRIAEFIRCMALELRTMALKAKLPVLASLLEMVALEADTVVKPPSRERRSA